MPGISPELEVYPVQHLPIIKAYADQLGLVGLIHHYVPTAMEGDAGTVVLGLVLDTLSGCSPLYHLAYIGSLFWRGAGMSTRVPHKRVGRQKSQSIIWAVAVW
jgi:hypothetical protein